MLQKILMCRPTYFKVVYEINPWMRKNIPTSSAVALQQWETLKKTIESCGAKVELVEPADGLPDMVFTANAGLVYGSKVYLSHFRHKERQGERQHFDRWFRQKGFQVVGGTCLSFEGAGDALFAGKEKLFAAYGFRTDPKIYERVENLGDFKIIKCELVDPRFYHIDTCFCPLNESLALCFPKAFREESRRLMEKEIELLVVPEKEAEAFACNSVVLGRHVITPSRCPETAKLLEGKGFNVHSVDVTEFLRAGGAVKCMTLALH